MCSDRLAEKTSRAAAFRTDCKYCKMFYFYSRNDYLTVTVDNNTVLMYKNMSNKRQI